MNSLFQSYSGAEFSPCRQYRYRLWRRWSDGPLVMYCGLNPSVADSVDDDPTVTRCISRAKDWGCGGMWMMNLFAYRATDPQVMKSVNDPVGIENDRHLTEVAAMCGIKVACWGVHGVYRNRADEVLKLIDGWKCLGTTKDGYPRHPLYVSYSQGLSAYT